MHTSLTTLKIAAAIQNITMVVFWMKISLESKKMESKWLFYYGFSWKPKIDLIIAAIFFFHEDFRYSPYHMGSNKNLHEKMMIKKEILITSKIGFIFRFYEKLLESFIWIYSRRMKN